MWHAFLHESHMEQQHSCLPAKERVPFKGEDDLQGAESGRSDCLRPAISTISKAVPAHIAHVCCQHFSASDISPFQISFPTSPAAELLEIPVHGVLHQHHACHSEVLKRLVYVLIHTCMSFVLVCPFGACSWQKYSLSSSAPSSHLFPQLLLPFHIL